MRKDGERNSGIMIVIIAVLAIGCVALTGLVFFLLFVIAIGNDESTESTESVISAGSSETFENTIQPVNSNIEPVKIEADAESVTVMIYMNGSDLETNGGEASRDISEMLEAGVGDKVNVIIQTMGTKKWHGYGISSKHSQRYRVNDDELELIDDSLGQLDCTNGETLSDFISFSRNNYPADRYILLFWDHGGGPVYGFGYDEWQDENEALTLDEIQAALEDNSETHFDIIGMDCCIMGNIETAFVLSPYCDYSILSEDFESGLGWYYKKWLGKLEENPGMPSQLLGKQIVDGMISENESSSDGDSSTMALIKEDAIPELMSAWIAFAYKNSDELLGVNYSRLHKARGRGFIGSLMETWDEDESNVTMSDYYVSDMLAIIESTGDEDDTKTVLKDALNNAVAYFGHTSDRNELTGLAVSLPYGDSDFYEQLSTIYSSCGFDNNYVEWLENCVSAEGKNTYNDYGEFEDSWSGWSCNAWSCSGSGDSSEGVTQEEDNDGWTYDYEEGMWYLYEDGTLYFYDDETETSYYYDESCDCVYAYDESIDTIV